MGNVTHLSAERARLVTLAKQWGCSTPQQIQQFVNKYLQLQGNNLSDSSANMDIGGLSSELVQCPRKPY